MDIVEVKNISKSYGSILAVSKLSFSVKEGEIFGLLGPNGAGKTTTISILSTLIKPDEGDAFILSHSVVKEQGKVKKLIGVVPQDIALYPTLTVYENLSFFTDLYGVKNKKSAIEKVLDIVQLKERAKSRVDTLSTGMKRRLNIAVGLLPEPKVLILDEPTVGVDAQTRANILESIKELNKDSGITVIYTSHYMDEVEYLCNRIAIIDFGKLKALGTLQELKAIVSEKDVIELSLEEEVNNSTKEKILKIEGVKSVEVAQKSIKIVVNGTNVVLPELIKVISVTTKIRSISIKEPDLETVFLALTGRALRE
ncbi:ABC transporter ATP-binding protein [Caldisericum exile]|uniref:ABC transporter ATP-binding protein n=1 Tax=Caldisericum exile (strain DSM 21853 / NBRC 104410 / AZM16c01) TaxID=511051 RepID=A0A7U6GDB7_CALEA|nr:ABC transporter ATP-binding protein [Caldisericum exile]BAL80217.1 putative ABC transporter ATP-binding protein [Caldisericum exile AZM16c01]